MAVPGQTFWLSVSCLMPAVLLPVWCALQLVDSRAQLQLVDSRAHRARAGGAGSAQVRTFGTQHRQQPGVWPAGLFTQCAGLCACFT